jgi:hypothetical protein
MWIAAVVRDLLVRQISLQQGTWNQHVSRDPIVEACDA